MRIQELYQIGYIFVPAFLYLLLKKYYLDKNQMYLLFTCCALISSIFMDGWIMQVVHLLLGGLHALIVLQLSVIQFQEAYRFRNEISESFLKNNSNNQYHWIVKIKLDETIVALIIVSLWIFLRVLATQSQHFGMEEVLYDGNTFLGLLITLAGWNCTFIEFTIVPFIWLLIYLFCLFIIKKAISTSGEDQIYRQFLVKYLIYPIIINFSLTILYNCRAFMKSEGLLDCYYYWREGSLFHIISYWGVSLITVIFFIAKEGKIQLKSDSSSRSSNNIIYLEDETKTIKLVRQ